MCTLTILRKKVLNLVLLTVLGYRWDWDKILFWIILWAVWGQGLALLKPHWTAAFKGVGLGWSWSRSGWLIPDDDYVDFYTVPLQIVCLILIYINHTDLWEMSRYCGERRSFSKWRRVGWVMSTYIGVECRRAWKEGSRWYLMIFYASFGWHC